MTSPLEAELLPVLLAGRDERRGQTPPSQQKALSAGEAYAVQDRLRATLVERGERVIGWKTALTTRATQETYRHPEPISGFLLASGVFLDGAEVPLARFVNPMVEAEIAFVLRRDLAGPGVTAARAVLAVEGVLPALEIPDLRYTGTPRATDLIADGAYAGAIVLGAALVAVRALDLAVEGLVWEHNGVVVATAAAAEVMGNPLNALTWLANHLGSRGLGLRAGDVVMSGSISKLLKPAPGDTIRARFTRLGTVAARFH